MKRTQIQLEETTFARLRELAYRRHVPIAQLVREAIDATYGASPAGMRVEDLGFVGGGAAGKPSGRPVSEDHDAVIDEEYGA